MTPEAAALVKVLRVSRGWVPAKGLALHAALQLGYRVTDRRIRAIASSLGGVVASAPGGKGYKLTRYCTAAEKAEVAARLRSQAKAMNKRAAAILRG
jgi:hypothetical protein